MPLVGLNRLLITWLRVVADSALLLPSKEAAVSVIEAPAPTNCWYLLFSFTEMVTPPLPLPEVNEIGVCCWSPRVTLRPPESLVVVSQMFTASLAACAGAASRRPPVASTPPVTATIRARSLVARPRGRYGG